MLFQQNSEREENLQREKATDCKRSQTTFKNQMVEKGFIANNLAVWWWNKDLHVFKAMFVELKWICHSSQNLRK